MKKGVLLAWIATQVTSIQVTRGSVTHTIPRSSLGVIGKHSVVKAVELKTWAKAHLAANPEINRTELQILFAQNGDQLLYTPPYQCETQPIELLWAYVKNYVRKVMDNHHSVDAVIQMTKAGFDGNLTLPLTCNYAKS